MVLTSVIKISEKTYRELMYIKGLIEILEGREAIMDEVVTGLLRKSKFKQGLLEKLGTRRGVLEPLFSRCPRES